MQVYATIRQAIVSTRDTHNTECAHEFLWGLNAAVDDERDKVAGNADHNHHRYDLENSDEKEGIADGGSAVSWDRHDG